MYFLKILLIPMPKTHSYVLFQNIIDTYVENLCLCTFQNIIGE